MKEDKNIIIIILLTFILGGVIFMAHNKVYGKCENLCDVEVIAKENIIVLEGSMTKHTKNPQDESAFVGFDTEIVLPEGLTEDNTVVISAMWRYHTNVHMWKSIPMELNPYNTLNDNSGYYMYKGAISDTRYLNLAINFGYSQSAMEDLPESLDYKVVLMKIS